MFGIPHLTLVTRPIPQAGWDFVHEGLARLHEGNPHGARMCIAQVIGRPLGEFGVGRSSGIDREPSLRGRVVIQGQSDGFDLRVSGQDGRVDTVAVSSGDDEFVVDPGGRMTLGAFKPPPKQR